MIRNEGSKPLEITTIRPDCDCAYIDMKQGTIYPGEYIYITAELALGEHKGFFHKRLMIQSNDPIHPYYVLNLKGYVEP